MKNRWEKATVVRKQKLNDSTCSIFIKTHNGKPFNFIPGQFITLDLPISERCIERWRSYSIASAPQDACDSYDLELCISKGRPGKGVNFLCDEIKAGDNLSFKGPAGRFTLDSHPGKTVIMICAETGIAPCRSILKAMKYHGDFPGRIELIHSVKTVEQLLYKTEMYQLMKEIPSFRYAINIAEDSHCIGSIKSIPHEISRIITQSGENTEVFICGWPEMVKKTLGLLINDLEFNREKIFYEIYR